MEAKSIRAYNDLERAKRYNVQTGFDPNRKQRMLAVTLQSLVELTPAGASLLELGAGTGLFSRQIVQSAHFAECYITDGAPTMLDLARTALVDSRCTLHFDILDFSAPGWHERYATQSFDAVTSSMAIHHSIHKQQLFEAVFQILKPGGVFVIADHLAGAAPMVDQIIGFERWRVKAAAQAKNPHDPEAILTFLKRDAEKQQAEGNHCESLMDYFAYLSLAGFRTVDCIWRDYWLAVIVAQKGT